MVSEPPKGGVELAFESIHEGFSVYKTKDGVAIKIRQVLIRIALVDVKPDGTGQLAAAGTLVFAVSSPVKGTPNPRQYTNDEIVAAIVEPEVQFETIREDWNEYDVEGVKVGVKLVLTSLAKTSLFEATGEPIYFINYQAVVRPIQKPEDRAKFKKIWEERGSKETPRP